MAQREALGMGADQLRQLTVEDDVREAAVAEDQRYARPRRGQQHGAGNRQKRCNSTAAPEQHQVPRFLCVRRDGEAPRRPKYLQGHAGVDLLIQKSRHPPARDPLAGNRHHTWIEGRRTRRVRPPHRLAIDRNQQGKELASNERNRRAAGIAQPQGDRVGGLAHHTIDQQAARGQRRGGGGSRSTRSHRGRVTTGQPVGEHAQIAAQAIQARVNRPREQRQESTLQLGTARGDFVWNDVWNDRSRARGRIHRIEYWRSAARCKAALYTWSFVRDFTLLEGDARGAARPGGLPSP